MGFLVDEDLPHSLVRALSAAGIGAQHVLESAPRGLTDDEVLKLAVSKRLSLLTGDLGFGNLLKYPLGTHAGIVVTRFPNETPTEACNATIVAALLGLTDEELTGSLVIIEPGRVRLRSEN